MDFKPRTLFSLIKSISRSAQRIAPKIAPHKFIALKLKSVSKTLDLTYIPNFWEVASYSPRRIPLSFSTFDISGLTRPIGNFFFSVKPDFATGSSEAASPKILPVTQPAKKSQCKFEKSMTARPDPGFSVARFFAASLENARKVALLAEALHNFETSPEKGEAITSTRSYTTVKRTNLIALRSGLTAEKMVAKWPRETPSYWRTISAPAKIPVKVTKPEWRTHKKKSKTSSVAPICGTVAESKKQIRSQGLDLTSALENDPRFISSQNPFKALEDIGDEEFQTPYCRKAQRKTLEIDLSSPIEADSSTTIMVNQKPMPVPTSAPLTAITPILAHGPLTMLSPPLTPIIVPVTISNTGSAQESLKTSRKQKNASATSSPVLRKPPILMPFKDTPESWRQTSSPPRSPSPLSLQPKNTGNEWQQVQKRKRRNTRNHEMYAPVVLSLDSALTPNLSPETLGNNQTDIEDADTPVWRISPNVVILYKSTKNTAQSKLA